ncbi:MAG TPA: hypothetical protein PK278_01345, partial [Gemmiger qucibialis]|nr:hypothetical protein [Gemmiger qucibialis]
VWGRRLHAARIFFCNGVMFSPLGWAQAAAHAFVFTPRLRHPATRQGPSIAGVAFGFAAAPAPL